MRPMHRVTVGACTNASPASRVEAGKGVYTRLEKRARVVSLAEELRRPRRC